MASDADTPGAYNVYGRELSAAEIAAGRHRELAGGLWDELGRLQFEYLRAEGLAPRHRLLDVGCGCLRGGVHFARYLEQGHYYGLDVNASLLAAGYEIELPAAGLAGRVPREHLLVTGRFEAWRFGVTFDFALAQSLFTHLPPAWIRTCLGELARVTAPGARFYATFFEAPPGPPQGSLRHLPGEIVSYAERDPFHYRHSDLAACAEGLPWRLEHVGDWGHPRAQRMLRCVRLEPDVHA
jgi:SAM-dependent methyltransferase